MNSVAHINAITADWLEPAASRTISSMSHNFQHVAAILQVLEQFEKLQNFGLSLDPV